MNDHRFETLMSRLLDEDLTPDEECVLSRLELLTANAAHAMMRVPGEGQGGLGLTPRTANDHPASGGQRHQTDADAEQARARLRKMELSR